MFQRPEQLNLWLKTKKAQNADLPFLSLIKTPDHYAILVQAVEIFSKTKPSYSEGIRILELITEILLMKQEDSKSEIVFAQTNSVESWIQNLIQLRYPNTSQRDSELEKKLTSLSWPYGSKIKFERRGDRAGVELKMFITSEADLIKILPALERVKQELESD